MLFKVKVNVPDVWFTTDELIKISKIGQDKNVEVYLRRSEKEEMENSFPPALTMCEAIADVKLSKPASLLVNALWKGNLPDNYNLDSLPSDIRKSYEITGKIERYEIPKSTLPNSVQDLLDKTYKMLVEAIRQVLGVASWKFAQNAPIYTFRYGRMLWSADGVNWKMTPVNFVADMTARPVHFWKDNEAGIQEFIDNGRDEPLSQELFREAWHQKGLNPRSALVIGTTALETGVKDLIAE